MSAFGCCVWWFVLGLLLGWLLNWLLSKLLRRDPPAASTTYRVDSDAGTTRPLRTDYNDTAARVRTDAVAPVAVAAAPIALDLAAARNFGFNVRGDDDLVIIEGIGPKIAELFHGAGIRTFAQLAGSSVARLQEVLDAGGARFRTANPGTWAEQAALAAANRWQELKALQDRLDAGVASSNDL